jgi:hypothetical protein
VSVVAESGRTGMAGPAAAMRDSIIGCPSGKGVARPGA